MPRIVAEKVDKQKSDGDATEAPRELVDVAKMPAPQTSSASGSNNNNTADATASANDNNNENNDSDSDMIGDSPSKNTRAAKKRTQEDEAPLSSDDDDDDDDVDIDAETAKWKKNKKKSKSSKKKSATDKASAKEKKARQLKWIEQMTMDHIVLTSDNNDVLSVGGVQWSGLKAYVKIAFITKNKIRVPSELRSNAKYGECIANTVKAEQYVKSTGKKKKDDSSPLTKPTCLTKDGTLYRIIEVITALVLNQYFQKTLLPFSRGDLDAVKKNTVLWEKLHSSYADPDLYKKIAMYDALLGYSIDESISAEYDELNVDMFKRIVEYIQAKYKKARNDKTTSGHHSHFSDYTSGNVWLLYLHTKLDEIGDTALMDCFYAELPDDALRSSSGGEYVAFGKQQGRTSRSPSPANSREKYTKSAQQSAIKAASDAIKNSHDTSRISHEEDRRVRQMALLQKLRRKCVAVKSQLTKYQYKHLDKSNSERRRLKEKYQTVKKEMKDCASQYEELKKKLNYESPVDSSDSSVDGKEDDNDEQGGNKDDEVNLV